MKFRRSPDGVGAVTPLSALAPGVPWSQPNNVSAASGNAGTTDNTSPLGAFFRAFGTMPQTATMPASGPGGTTTDPAASGAPSGQSMSQIEPGAPETTPNLAGINKAFLADPAYWYLYEPIDLIIMLEGESMAMADPSILTEAASYYDVLAAQLGA
jgi:hypothetical protein